MTASQLRGPSSAQEKPSISRVLVAGRGSVAIHILASCRALGLSTVAVFTEIDRSSLHVQRADRAACLGTDPSAYRDPHLLVSAAQRNGADALHPGNGPAAEDPELAAACQSAGLTFIGPNAEVLESLGDKSHARDIAERVGVPVVPGATPIAEQVAQLGYPVMLKATTGRGGRGLTVVDHPDDFAEALEQAQRDAEADFGDDRVYVEKRILGARHIEVQLLADREGNIVHLGDRECSVQRHFQKLVEEAPAPNLTRQMRESLSEAAVLIAESVGYLGAGTVEFLVKDDDFYFLGVNARLQVEHAVTEAILGIDLVEQQLRVARGETAPWEDRLKPRVAMECRVLAEDVNSRSHIAALTIPADEWLRVDVAVQEDMPVRREHDPTILTVVAVGSDRELARARMRAALQEICVLGVRTNLPYLQRVLDARSFAVAKTNTDTFATPATQRSVPEAALAAAALFSDTRQQPQVSDMDSPAQTHRWDGGLRVDTRPVRGQLWDVTVDGGERRRWRVVKPAPQMWIEDDSGDQHRFHVALHETEVWIHGGGRTHSLAPEPSVVRDNRATVGVCTSPVAGRLVSLAVSLGDSVSIGQTLATVQGPDGEQPLRAPQSGTVIEIYVRVGQNVTAGGVVTVLGE